MDPHLDLRSLRRGRNGPCSKERRSTACSRAGGGDYDVFVAGAGPAGFGAALAASTLGARTLLVEARGFPGGIAATSLWMPINRLKKEGGSRGGVHEKLVRRLESFGPDACREGKVTWTDGDGLHVHPDYLKEAMFSLLEEAGCAYRLDSPVVGARTEGGCVREAIVATPGEPQRFTARVFIDCTGDGALSYHAGAKVEVGQSSAASPCPSPWALPWATWTRRRSLPSTTRRTRR